MCLRPHINTAPSRQTHRSPFLNAALWSSLLPSLALELRQGQEHVQPLAIDLTEVWLRFVPHWWNPGMPTATQSLWTGGILRQVEACSPVVWGLNSLGRATTKSGTKTDPNLTGMPAQPEDPRGEGLLGRLLEFPASGPIRNSTRSLWYILMTMGHGTLSFWFWPKTWITDYIVGRCNCTCKVFLKTLQGDRSVVLPSALFHPSHLYRPSPGKWHMFLERVLRNLSKGCHKLQMRTSTLPARQRIHRVQRGINHRHFRKPWKKGRFKRTLIHMD